MAQARRKTTTKKTSTKARGDKMDTFLGAGLEWRQKIFRELSEPFEESEIEKTYGSTTHKGYDTTGVKYDFLIMRLNKVVGIGGWRQIDKTEQVPSGSAKKTFAYRCDVTVELLREDSEGKMVPWAEVTAPGGHASRAPWDAEKGAITNAFKRAVRMWGMGAHQYWRNEDDDHSYPKGAYDDIATGGKKSVSKKTTTNRTQSRRNQEEVKVGTDIDDALAHLEKIAGSHWPKVRYEMETHMNVQLKQLNARPRAEHSDIISGLRTWVPRVKSLAKRYEKEGNGASKIAERVVMESSDQEGPRSAADDASGLLSDMPPPGNIDDTFDPNIYGA